ncbi:hypothetical protein ACFL1R_09180 [Candidatus Latescibacterota bacterium]
MTSLRKHIIPLQKEDLVLAFNIQSYDTIKYKPSNIASELDRAIKDAIKITETVEKKKMKNLFSQIRQSYVNSNLLDFRKRGESGFLKM